VSIQTIAPETVTSMTGAEPADAVTIAVQRGWRVMVVSDLHLGAVPEPGGEWITSDLARRLETWAGPGVLVVAGDAFALSEQPNNSPQRALTAHPRLHEALRRFTTDNDRELVFLSGGDDGRMLVTPSDGDELGVLGARLGARADLSIDTGAGVESVRVEHARLALDAATDSSGEIGERESSHRFYGILQRIWWLPVLAPILILVAGLAISENIVDHRHSSYRYTPLRLFYFGCSTISVQIVLVMVMVGIIRRSAGCRPEVFTDPNGESRALAAELAGDRFDGYVGAGSHSPELVDLGECWYANPGCASRHVTRRAARFGLPAIYAPSNELSWVELEAGATLHVSVVACRRDDRPLSLLQRLVSRTRLDVPPIPTHVARLETATVWPTPSDPFRRLTRVRRRGAASLLAIGTVDVLSAVTPPIRERLHVVRQIIPVGTPAVAAGLVAVAGVALMMLAIGMRRGRHIAWQLAVLVLVASIVGHLLKGFDVEEALLAALIAGWLVAHRRAFGTRAGEGRLRRAAALTTVGLVAVAAAATGWIVSGTHRRIGDSLSITADLMIGRPAAELPPHQRLLVTALPAVSVLAVLLIAWYVIKARHPPSDDPVTTARAWEIVRQYGRGTLDYFALRDDKRHFISEGSVVAYNVVNGTAVVSPDPIGPADQRYRVWADFRQFAASNGWRVTALGAGSQWLPVYRSSGMTALYIGDESIVDVQRFNLQGGRNKSLRKAVNRVAKAGYTVEFHDPAHLDDVLADQLRRLATRSRQGSVERGFSMTLSRLFDRRDQGLLLAVARDAQGRPAAFCQYVPAAGIDGFSLDLMRRGDASPKHDQPAGGQTGADDGSEQNLAGHPNGLTEFVVVRTIEYLREQGRHGLGLHFATMRAVLAGQAGTRLWHRALADLMYRMSDDMQIESLWKFNAKFDPDWLPRYVVVDTLQSTLFAGFAIAKVESLWELPVIGRFMRSGTDPLAQPPNAERDSSTSPV
jgi:lysylphosphatidylglycerol synthetase-like protein (DUF2156 family)